MSSGGGYELRRIVGSGSGDSGGAVDEIRAKGGWCNFVSNWSVCSVMLGGEAGAGIWDDSCRLRNTIMTMKDVIIMTRTRADDGQRENPGDTLRSANIADMFEILALRGSFSGIQKVLHAALKPSRPSYC